MNDDKDDGDTPCRVFKTAWFAKAARKAHIPDAELLDAIAQAVLGQVVDLGGGVYKKRLNRNAHRAIILAKRGDCWVFQHLFAKKDQDNISESDLLFLRKLAKGYAAFDDEDIEQLLDEHEWVEIKNEHDDSEVQE